MNRALVVVIGGLALSVACSRHPSKPYVLAGNKRIDGKVLEHGREAYLQFCYGCHGAAGDGKGPASLGMRPPPRDFGQGLFKFGGVSAGQLPTDEALLRTLRRGLNGTPMLAWDIPETQRRAIVQYLKTFSKRWQEEGPGDAVEISRDPWVGRPHEAVALGKEVYHVAGAGHAGCSSCHPAYATRVEISEMTQKVTGQPVTEFGDNMYRSTLRETEYPLAVDDKGQPSKLYQELPPDFLINRVKTVFAVGARVEGKPYTAEDQRVDLYRVIAAGVGGAAMPQWQGALPEENLWALVYYVQSLIAMRDTPAAYALRSRLDSQRP